MMMLALMAATMLTSAGAMTGTGPGFTFSSEPILPGFDSKFCKIQPIVASDGDGNALLAYQKLLLTGSDVFYGQWLARSRDGGRSWCEPKVIDLLADTHEDGFRVARCVSIIGYNRSARRWFGLGLSALYKDDRVPYQKSVNGRPYGSPLQMEIDFDRGLVSCRKLDFPLPYEFAMPFGQHVELENGEMLVPFYYRPPNSGECGRVLVIRYAFRENALEVVKAGAPVTCDQLARGLNEPSLARLGDKFYLTLRSDERGLWAVSDDGLNFSGLRDWTWEDGTRIGNANTQQHWLRGKDELCLAYTRVRSDNLFVFRNRAPILAARFDPKRGCLVRSTETELVPNRGARLGNFFVTDVSDRESWLVTAEWMQPNPAVCKLYGSDNSLWFVRVAFDGKSAPPKPGRGILCLTFDDRNTASWVRELPRFAKYGAHATFFVNGELDPKTLGEMRQLAAAGHSLGLHGRWHAPAVRTVREKGVEAYLAGEVEPQLDAARKAGLDIKNWGYPVSERNDETDFALARRFGKLRCGHLWRKDVARDPLKTHDEAFAPACGFGRELVVFGTPVPSASPAMESDLAGALERAAVRDEALVLYAHNIRTDGVKDPHDISPEQLEFILSTASSLGLRTVGFDELGSARRGDGWDWHDGATLPQEGRAWTDTETPYVRLPNHLAGKVPRDVWELSRHSSGICYRFTTDSKRIRVKWTVGDKALSGHNMTGAGRSGVDVYGWDEKRGWRFVQGSRPTQPSCELDFGWTPGRPCMIYLPLYNRLTSFEVGLQKGAKLAALPPRANGVTKPVVCYGTSITQGASASRPGLAWTAQAARFADVPFVNLGFSGAGRMETSMLEALAEIDASLYVLDCLWNMDVKTLKTRFEPFVRELHRRRPATPILCAEDCNTFCARTEKGRFVEAVIAKLKAEDRQLWANLHFISNLDEMEHDCEETVDGCHPNDCGMKRMGEAFGRKYREILD